MQHPHADVELCDGFHLQPKLLIKSPSPPSLHSCAPPYVPYICLDLAHACIMFTHGLAQLQDAGAVNVHHLNSPHQPILKSLLSMLKDAACNENSSTNTSLGLVLPALQAEVMANRLGLHATHGHTQVLAVQVTDFAGLIAS